MSVSDIRWISEEERRKIREVRFQIWKQKKKNKKRVKRELKTKARNPMPRVSQNWAGKAGNADWHPLD
jgi:hypothetical protein